MPIGFRSWRDTGITSLALASVDVVKVQRRAGHDTIQTTMGYVKAAEDVSGAAGTPFPELPANLVRPGTRPSAATNAPVFQADAVPAQGFAPRLYGVHDVDGVQARQKTERWSGARLKTEVPAQGFENGYDTHINEASRAYATPDAPKGADTAPKSTDRASSGPAFGPAGDVVEAALARALDAAAAAARFDVVAQLARELEARRLAREPTVIALDASKAGRR